MRNRTPISDGKAAANKDDLVADDGDLISEGLVDESAPQTFGDSALESAPAGELVGTFSQAMCDERIDKILSELIGGVSRNRLQALIADGALTVDGVTIRDTAYRVKRPASWHIVIPKPEEPTPAAEPMALDVVYEDEHLIVINKPVGLVVHPSAGHADGTLVNGLLHHCRGSLSGIGGVARPGIVHRLDRDTTGLMVVAKTDTAHAALTAQFVDRSLSRGYWAVVRGVPHHAQGRIDAPIGRSQNDRKKMAVVAPPAGRAAATRYRVMDRQVSGGASFLECRLETGRTHQIRVHMAHIGHPLIGDQTYGRSGTGRLGVLAPRFRPLAAAFDRQALHAVRLTFQHPATNARVTFHANPPSDFATLVQGLEMKLPTLPE
jgi:23S rRNA pseudouridine1911/1915/1917 synthase